MSPTPPVPVVGTVPELYPQTQETPAPGVPLRIKVVDASGHPVEGALVRARAEYPKRWAGETRTDSAGIALLAGLPRAHFEIAVEKETYGRAWIRKVDPYFTTQLTVGLKRESVIYGRVRGLESDPESRVQVTAGRPGFVPDVKVDDEGNYRIGGLPEGKFDVQVRIVESSTIIETEPKQVMLGGAGDSRRLDFELQENASRGSLSLNGEPLRGTRFSLRAAEKDAEGKLQLKSGTAFLRTDIEGSYEVRWLEPGLYVLGVTLGRNGVAERECFIDGDGACTVDLFGGSATFTVLDAATREPLSGASVAVKPDETLLRLESRLTTNESGVATVEFLPAGPHLVRAVAPGYPSAEEKIEAGVGEYQFEILLHRAAPTSIRVFDATTGQMIAATIDLEPLDGAPLVQKRFTSREGRVDLDVPAGRYLLVAKSSGLAPRTIEVPLPQESPLDIALTVGGDLEILSESGVAGTLTIERAGTGTIGTVAPACIVRAGGRADFHSLEPGKYVLELRDDDKRVIRNAEVIVNEGKVLRVRW